MKKTTERLGKIKFLLLCLICAFSIWLFLPTFEKVNQEINITSQINENQTNILQIISEQYQIWNNSQTIFRGKRYLDFTKGTRMSWRTTVKNNILRSNTLWGYGWGFRVNFPFPNKEDRLRPFFKRDLMNTFSYLLDGHGLDGTACLLKLYCSTVMEPNGRTSGGMLNKVLHLLLSFNKEDSRQFPFLQKKNCRQLFHSHCPLSFNSISTYTDDI